MSDIRANTISDATGTGPITLTGQYAAKAWVNFNGAGTVTIRDSVNITSVTDIGVGQYTVTIGNDMASRDYSVGASGEYNGWTGPEQYSTNLVGSVKIYSISAANSAYDRDLLSSQIFGDLA